MLTGNVDQSFATRAIECGFDPKSLSEILGHSYVKIDNNYLKPKYEKNDFIWT